MSWHLYFHFGKLVRRLYRTIQARGIAVPRNIKSRAGWFVPWVVSWTTERGDRLHRCSSNTFKVSLEVYRGWCLIFVSLMDILSYDVCIMKFMLDKCLVLGFRCYVLMLPGTASQRRIKYTRHSKAPVLTCECTLV